jgi:glycosyltransferase involved in cell wall biosynthesis
VRVLHLSAGNLYGGIETYLVTLARARGLCPEMEPHFGLCFGGRLAEELAAAGVAVHDLGPVRLSRPWTVLRARRRLSQRLCATRFDAVMTHGCWPHAVFAPVARGAGVRVAHAVHSDLARPGWLDRWAARTAPDVAIANSHFTAAPAAKLFCRSRVEVAYLPVAPPEPFDRAKVRSAVRSAVGAPADAVVVLQASRLERWKGHAAHLEALGRLRDVPQWEAWFAGGGQKAGEEEYRAELERLAARTGLADRVRFLGQRSDVSRLMAAADVYCQPNTGPEPFGLAFVEALYAGLPVVTSAFGGAVEIITPACGVLTPPGDPGAVSCALRALIRDPAARAALGAHGPARARELCDPAGATARLRALCSRPAHSTGAP